MGKGDEEMYLATVNTPSLNLEDNVSLSGNVESVGPQSVRHRLSSSRCLLA